MKQRNRFFTLFIFSLVILIFSSSYGAADKGDGPCITFIDIAQTACGYTVNSALGQGAVELCGDCYACGYKDNICPYDFESIGVDCGACPDPDCLINISGIVFPPGDTRNGLPFAQISVLLLHLMPPLYTGAPFAITANELGKFEYFQIPRGNYQLKVTYTDLQDFYINVSEIIANGKPDGNGGYTYDFSMKTIECNPDKCSTTMPGVGEKCQLLCVGQMGCTYNAGNGFTNNTQLKTFVQKCIDQNIAGGGFYIGLTSDLKQQIWQKCCNGEIYYTTRLKTSSPETKAKNLVIKTNPITYKWVQAQERATFKFMMYDK
jgi:hypothetical protein